MRIGAAAVALAVLGGAAYGVWRASSASPAIVTPAPPVAPNAETASRLSLAQSSLDARNYRAAATYAEAVLDTDPGHADARRIRDEARTALAHFDDAIEQARTQLARGDVQAANASLEIARAIDSSAAAVTEVAARIADTARERSATTQPAERKPSSPPPSREAGAGRQAPASSAAATPTSGSAEPPPATTSPASEAPAPVASPPARVELPPPTPTPSEPVAAPPPPPVVSRPPESAKPEPPEDETDDAAIRRVVATYGRAIETKDIALFRSIKPNLSGDEERRLQQGFRAVSSQRVSLTIASIDRRGNTAVVVVQRRDQLDVGGRRQNVDARQTLTLTRAGGGWAIVDIR